MHLSNRVQSGHPEKDFPALLFGLTCTLGPGWDSEILTASSELKSRGACYGKRPGDPEAEAGVIAPGRGGD